MITPKTLVSGIELTASGATIYTCPVNTTVIVTHAVFNNTDNVTRNLSMWIVPYGEGADNTTLVLNAFALATNANYVSGELMGAVLNHGDTIQASGLNISVYISGYEQT